MVVALDTGGRAVRCTFELCDPSGSTQQRSSAFSDPMERDLSPGCIRLAAPATMGAAASLDAPMAAAPRHEL